VREALAVGSFQPGVGNDGRATVTGPADEDGIEVPRLDTPTQVCVEKVEAGTRSPVTQQSRLDVRRSKGPSQERIIHQIDLASGVMGRAVPVIGPSLDRSSFVV
jgi:hypothetical protein